MEHLIISDFEATGESWFVDTVKYTVTENNDTLGEAVVDLYTDVAIRGQVK